MASEERDAVSRTNQALDELGTLSELLIRNVGGISEGSAVCAFDQVPAGPFRGVVSEASAEAGS